MHVRVDEGIGTLPIARECDLHPTIDFYIEYNSYASHTLRHPIGGDGCFVDRMSNQVRSGNGVSRSGSGGRGESAVVQRKGSWCGS